MINEYNGKKVITLYYNTELRRFYDDFNTIIDDIYRIITPNQVSVFLKDKEYRTFEDVTHSFIVALIYPEDETIMEYINDLNMAGYNKLEDEKDVMRLYFDPETNRFYDECGKVMDDIYRYVSPGRVLIFRKYKNKYLFPSKDNSYDIELNYPGWSFDPDLY